MPHEVIMPALGMAQDRGLIVSWLKQPGDAVKAGDALFEVETDKATMEVEAAVDGFLTNVSAAAGEEVAVGNVIAQISETAEGTPVTPAAKAVSIPAEAAPDVAHAHPAKQDVLAVPKAPMPDSAMNEGRVLASPKARRLALERNIDLQDLVRLGYRQPIRSTDLAGLPAPRVAPPALSAEQMLRLAAEVDAAPLTAFLRWMEEEGTKPGRAAVLAAFAGAALRALMPRQPLFIAIQHQDRVRTFSDPDLVPFGEIGEADGVPDILLRDLAGTKLTSVTFGVEPQPVVTLTGAETLTLTLDASRDLLPPALALEFLAGFAERIAEPLQQLL